MPFEQEVQIMRIACTKAIYVASNSSVKEWFVHQIGLNMMQTFGIEPDNSVQLVPAKYVKLPAVSCLDV